MEELTSDGETLGRHSSPLVGLGRSADTDALK